MTDPSAPSHHFHAAVWMDHREARIFHFSAADVAKEVIHAANQGPVHRKAGSIGSGHAADDLAYFTAVAAALVHAGEILFTGPGGAKTDFVNHLRRHEPQLAARIVAVETVDHPTDGQLVAWARERCKIADRMTPQRAMH